MTTSSKRHYQPITDFRDGFFRAVSDDRARQQPNDFYIAGREAGKLASETSLAYPAYLEFVKTRSRQSGVFLSVACEDAFTTAYAASQREAYQSSTEYRLGVAAGRQLCANSWTPDSTAWGLFWNAYVKLQLICPAVSESEASAFLSDQTTFQRLFSFPAELQLSPQELQSLFRTKSKLTPTRL